ncbi:T-complex protein 10 C-terminus [Carpediemonas membranifera]|nr:T-complex protein 10 C-terminus [Carpediemonas membranifera]|eukprot:KAG9397546.1 T-complex protein 10 C-terminus [Carpediemonas membranifera]
MRDETDLRDQIAHATEHLRTLESHISLAQTQLKNKVASGTITTERFARSLTEARRTLEARKTEFARNQAAIEERTRETRAALAEPAYRPDTGRPAPAARGVPDLGLPFATPSELIDSVQAELEEMCSGEPVAVKEANKRVGTRYESGVQTVKFVNGTQKTVMPDGTEIVQFYNGDLKKSFPDGMQVYLYADVHTLMTTLPDGVEVYRFKTGQIEKHLLSGQVEIYYMDGTTKVVEKGER